MDFIKKINYREWFIYIFTLVATILLCKYIVFFGVVPSGSMMPTIQEGDIIVGNRLSTDDNLHLYIEYIEGEKFPKNKLYTRYTQEHGQLKLSKKGK